LPKSRIENAAVAAVFADYPPAIRAKLLRLRALILSTASRTKGVGPLEETLRWGEPSYIPSQSKSGSLVRIGWKTRDPDRYALHFHCQTSLVETFRRLYPETFEFAGNRSLVFAVKAALPVAPLRHCIALALTYRLRS
jgi:hypothetical protein